MSYETIRLDVDGPVATLRLHRPERMNAVIEAMYREIRSVLDLTAADADNRVLVITGSVLERDGTAKQAFCAGADLKEHASGSRTMEQRRVYIELAHDTTRRIAEHPRPVVAAVNGPARGAGAELAVCCDLVVMAEEATLAFPETGLGTFVGGGVTWHLPRLVGLARARELVYTGRVLTGPEAVALGLAIAAVPVARLAAEVHQLALGLASRAPLSLRLAKRELAASAGRPLEEALAAETRAILQCMDSEDWHEGVQAFAEKRAPRYTGR